ncbi:uncharacterized protein EV420DRAFT_1746863 [Desarmillaria tabescens]|uniref:Uncharacterized protein n=1 Tax=Armillaria tabescens TaxID=1929756 RepID=A0AA39N7V3_ARMTA|nr:uncharacterized protein EV420DRAFT_1746863 [Desarmillaria tabescens]KAK0460645.1 hypothetical protein EV420DRAFT_1746863 [Desarmillaria tabescens]
MVPFQWLTQLFSPILSFIMPSEPDRDTMIIFASELQQRSTDATSLLNSLVQRYDFLLQGVGNIHVERVEYRKSQRPGSPLEHEYLVVTVKESSGAERRGYLMVDRLNSDSSVDAASLNRTADAEERLSTSSSSTTTADPSGQWETTNRIHRAGAKLKRISKWQPSAALDRVIILRNTSEAFDEQGQCPFDILMTMDLRPAQRRVTLEHFLLLIKTTSNNTPFATGLPTLFGGFLELETRARVERTSEARRQGTHSYLGRNLVVGRGDGVNEGRTPETIRSQWEAVRVVEDQTWAALQQEVLAPVMALEEERAGRRQAEQVASRTEQALQQERAARQWAEAEVSQFRAALASFQHPASAVSLNV